MKDLANLKWNLGIMNIILSQKALDSGGGQHNTKQAEEEESLIIA